MEEKFKHKIKGTLSALMAMVWESGDKDAIFWDREVRNLIEGLDMRYPSDNGKDVLDPKTIYFNSWVIDKRINHSLKTKHIEGYNHKTILVEVSKIEKAIADILIVIGIN